MSRNSPPVDANCHPMIKKRDFKDHCESGRKEFGKKPFSDVHLKEIIKVQVYLQSFAIFINIAGGGDIICSCIIFP